MLIEGQSWLFRPHVGSGPTTPRCGDQAVPAGQYWSPSPEGATHVATAGTSAGPLHHSRPGRAQPTDPNHEGRARLQAADPGPSLPSTTRSSTGPTCEATPSSSPVLPPTVRGPRTSSSVVCTSWPSLPTSSPATTSGSSFPTSMPGAPWPTWPNIDQVEDAWDELARVTNVTRIVPITYMNSSAGAGKRSSASTAARSAPPPTPGPSWSGRSTGRAGPVLPRLALAAERDDMATTSPRCSSGTLTRISEATRITRSSRPRSCSGGAGARCISVRPEHAAAFRAEHPNGEVIVHPSAPTTSSRSRTGSARPSASWSGSRPHPRARPRDGYRIHMVQRMAREHPDKTIVSLDPLVCPCSTMFRIDAPHLAWCLERLVEGRVVNQIKVDPRTAEWARAALQRMLDIT